MSLTGTDLQAVRTIGREENAVLDGKVTALQNDVKEIYYMIAKMQNAAQPSARFNKPTIEQKMRTVYAELLATAEQADVALS
ncbi:MAG: hypothetical protein WA843_03950 [Candidatus Saccharimonadales bacterium]